MPTVVFIPYDLRLHCTAQGADIIFEKMKIQKMINTQR